MKGTGDGGVGRGNVDLTASLILLLQGSQESQESDLPKMLSNVIIGLGVTLLLVIVIMTMALVCARKRYCCHHSLCLQAHLSQHPRHPGCRKSLGLGIRYFCIQFPMTSCDWSSWAGFLPSPSLSFPICRMGVTLDSSKHSRKQCAPHTW